jgi:hypothetical protein
MFAFNKKATEIQAAVEYCAPHWIVVIRNPRESKWTPLRSLTKKVRVQDEFGNEKSSRPAIESFESKQKADVWVKENMPGVALTQRSSVERNKDHEWFGSSGPSISGEMQ